MAVICKALVGWRLQVVYFSFWSILTIRYKVHAIIKNTIFYLSYKHDYYTDVLSIGNIMVVVNFLYYYVSNG